MIKVAAAVIENRNGRILIARRKADISLGGYWEFRGGKIEDGETPAECAVRELREEMNVRIDTGDIIAETVYDYGDKVVNLIAVRAILLDGNLHLRYHDEIRWVSIHEMDDFLFAPADEAIIEKIRQDSRNTESTNS